MHSRLTKRVVLLELTVPWESRMQQQHVFNVKKYEDLVAVLRQDGYTTRHPALVVDARGLSAISAYDALQQLGLRGQSSARTLKRLGEAAERASCWLRGKHNER